MIKTLLLLAIIFLLSNLFPTIVAYDWDCDRSWPQLDLFLPVGFHSKQRANEWNDIFLRTFLLYWPIKRSQTRVSFVLDEEDRNREAVSLMRSKLSSYDILASRYQIVFNNVSKEVYNFDGWKRQQYLMFYGDNFTLSEYIGFVDTDCAFITYIDREDLFEIDPKTGVVKPVINGKIGDPTKRLYKEKPIWYEITSTTFEVLGMLSPMKCMAYFPVIIKRDHLREIREFLEKRFGMSFPEVFRQKISKNWFGQFDIFCAYLYYYHRGDYAWYAHDISPEWDGLSPPAMHGQDANRSIFSKEMFFPKPRIALHARYNSPEIAPDSDIFACLLQTGVCLSPSKYPLGSNEFSRCLYYNSEAKMKEMVYEEFFRFQHYRWDAVLPKSELLKAMTQRVERIKHCTFDFNGQNISHIMSHFPIRENVPFITPQTGRKIFVFKNESFITFAGLSKFVQMGYDKVPLQRWDLGWLRGFEINTI